MCEDRISKSKVFTKLLNKPQLTVPRNVKLLQQCLNDYWQSEHSEFDPAELFDFCVTNAGLNGQNAYMRAFISSIKILDSPESIYKLKEFVNQNKDRIFVENFLKSSDYVIFKTNS